MDYFKKKWNNHLASQNLVSIGSSQSPNHRLNHCGLHKMVLWHSAGGNYAIPNMSEFHIGLKMNNLRTQSHLPGANEFTHWGRDKMAAILQTCNHIFVNENVKISIKFSLKFVSKGPINNIPTLVPIMAWRRSGDKPLSEPMMVSLPTHICVTRPQWVKEPFKTLRDIVSHRYHEQLAIYNIGLWCNHRNTI